VGPLLVANGPTDIKDIDSFKIAIPGFNTTANLLLSLAFPNAKNKTELVFSEIEAAVLDGTYDAGLIIHEGRFTYEKKGLSKLIDLGDWWEKTMDAAIPLGGIVIRRSLDKKLCAAVDSIIKESLAYSWKRYPELSDFIRDNAQEMEEDVMRKHINLYVNGYTTDLGEKGRNAITTLFEKAKAGGLINGEMAGSIFY
jgi:1,4-dihydroxy-6-naphthoate synthase